MPWLEILKVVLLPLIIAMIGWSGNAWLNRRFERHKRKEDRYQGFLKSVRGFYESNGFSTPRVRHDDRDQKDGAQNKCNTDENTKNVRHDEKEQNWRRKEKEKFITELRLAWLYCPDGVIKAGNDFLDAVSTASECENKDKATEALFAFQLALRVDLLGKRNLLGRKKTKLTKQDFRNYRST